jgi:SSS family solute:Na+ symporter
VVVSFLAAVVFVYVSGLRGIAWTNFLQAILMLGGMLGVGLIFPERYFGGLRPMFDSLLAAKPDHVTLPDSSGLGLSWYVSTALLSGLGFWMWPHIVMATYGAASERVVRRNATLLPLYQLALLPVILVGFTCAARAAHDPEFAARVTEPDHAMLVALVGEFPPLVAGLIGAGGLAAALSTATALILGSATLAARNIVQQGFRPAMDDTSVARLARGLVPVLTAGAVALAFAAPRMLVSLLLLGYSGITQFFPAVVFGLFARWPRPRAIGAGLAAGVATVIACQLGLVAPPAGLHLGFFGLLVNVLVVLAVHPFVPPVDRGRLERFERALAPSP